MGHNHETKKSTSIEIGPRVQDAFEQLFQISKRPPQTNPAIVTQEGGLKIVEVSPQLE